jgi:ferrous iron transport protein A
MEMTQIHATLAGTPVEVRASNPGLAGLQLADLATGAVARVVSVAAGDAVEAVDLGRRLAELGFLPGERLRIVARGLMGREPIAVRIGTGTFALRLFEAACIRVAPEPSLQP